MKILKESNNLYIWDGVSKVPKKCCKCKNSRWSYFNQTRVFKNYTSLVSVDIPDSVTSIGNNVFKDCKSLQSIYIPDSVIKIGDYAFASCDSLKQITGMNSVTSILQYSFYWCKSLESINIPDSVTSIGKGALSCCRSLREVTGMNSVTSIGEYAFSHGRLLKSIYIPDSVTSLSGGAFFDSDIENIIGMNSISSGIDRALTWCDRIKSIDTRGSIFYQETRSRLDITFDELIELEL